MNANKKTRGLPKEMFLATDKAETNIEKASLLNKFFVSSFTTPEEVAYPDIVIRWNPTRTYKTSGYMKRRLPSS